MSSGRKDLCSGIFFLLFAGFLYWQSFQIKMSTSDSLGPQFFPRLVVVLMVILAAIVILKAVATIKKENTTPASAEAAKGFSWNIPMLLTIGLLVSYFLLIKSVGYIVLTAIYLFCQMFILLPKGAIKNVKYLAIVIATSIIVPTGIYMLFYKVFMIFLPAGILG
ncbi:MAG: tripartite tricarboxylate transporter TctB family protein [Angelakisella sp.]|nr:tripartite tricarboxylate transporter TctB family protein [Angelakisella sp.]